jgi:hypothetical protein
VQEKVTDEFVRSRNAWEATNGSPEAEELLSSALIADRLSDPSVLTAAVRVQAGTNTAHRLSDLAERVIQGRMVVAGSFPQPDNLDRTRAELARRKALLILNPRDAWLLSETALLYANLGQITRSRQLLVRALHARGIAFGI